MDIIIRSINNPVNDMAIHMNELINDLDIIMKTMSKNSLVSVVDCQSGQSCHQQDKQILEGCLCNQEAQVAVQ